jgi:hypothetical protein
MTTEQRMIMGIGLDFTFRFNRMKKGIKKQTRKTPHANLFQGESMTRWIT